MEKNIVLIGMKGCGKSTVGTLLARALDRELVDTDHLIEEREGRSIPDIFAAEGEGYFRDRELEISQELAARSGLIVACGGGLPLRQDCMAALKGSGTVFFINRDPGVIYDTVSMKHRPLGQGEREDFLERFARREPVYRQWADYVIEGHSEAAEAAQRILEVLK